MYYIHLRVLTSGMQYKAIKYLALLIARPVTSAISECDEGRRGSEARAEAEERGGRARDTAARGDGRAVRSDEVIA